MAPRPLLGVLVGQSGPGACELVLWLAPDGVKVVYSNFSRNLFSKVSGFVGIMGRAKVPWIVFEELGSERNHGSNCQISMLAFGFLL